MQTHRYLTPHRSHSILRLIKENARALALLAVFAVSATQAHAQGCVVARGGGANAITDGDGYLDKGHWEVSFAFRHFLSSRHFVGDDEQTQRAALHNEVINHSNFADMAVTYAWSKRLDLTVTVPGSWSDRSQLANNVRIHTQAHGLGDIRLSANFWVWDPETNPRGNLSVGLGVKFKTGDSEAQDYFPRPVNPSVGYVDSSIQPGDGGTGGTVELQGFYRLFGNFSAYGNGFYLFNPDERVEATGWSIPDQYMVRGGVSYAVPQVKGLSASLGLRNEGVVAHDLFGGSLGRRRPGFAVSVEPGITFTKSRYSGTITVPVAIHRARVPSYGTLSGGDAAFADYTFNASFSIRL